MATVHRDERRRFSRIVYEAPAQLLVGTRRLLCTVRDVSFKGVLLEGPGRGPVGLGQACTVVIHLGGGEEVIQLQGKIAHLEQGRLGVRSTGMDLDALSHLRRLMELNLGDEPLVHRELGALVGAW